MLKKDKNSRRIVVSAWNPLHEKNMALPPCHLLYQFYVENGGLSCQMYQRSADMFLGIPFNIASYALLTHLIAKITDLRPHKLKICIGDAHIYKDHISQCKTQIEKNPYNISKNYNQKRFKMFKRY